MAYSLCNAGASKDHQVHSVAALTPYGSRTAHSNQRGTHLMLASMAARLVEVDSEAREVDSEAREVNSVDSGCH